MALSKDELQQIAELVANAQVSRRDEAFRISPEQHYKDHLAIRELVTVFDEETRQSLRDMSKAFRTGRWVILLIVAAIIGLGFAVYMMLHPKTLLGMFLE